MPNRPLLMLVVAALTAAAFPVPEAVAKRQCGPAGCAQLEPGPCANLQFGGAEEDELRGTGRGDRLYGRGGHDRLTSGAGADCLRGGGGSDFLNGNKGSDRVWGQAGADRLGGDSGRDRLSGGPGRDEISAGRGSDWMLGGAGADLLRAAGGGRDVVRCGPGRDRAFVDRLDVVRGCELPMAACGSGSGSGEASIELGGRQIQLVAGRGSLWALTCDRGCTARSRPSSGRIVRIDPESGGAIASARLSGASALAVGAGGVYVTDFWGGTVRRLDPRTLRVIARLGLKLPFELVPGDRVFLPYDVAVTARALWVSTARGVLARVAPDLNRVATVRLPLAATGEIAAGDGAVWVAEQLAGVYRVNAAAGRVVARIEVGPRRRRLAIQSVALGEGAVFAIGTRIGKHQVATGENALVRIDPASNRVESVTSLPRDAGSAVAYGARALWIAQRDGPSIYRIDPETGRVTAKVGPGAGAAFAIAGGRLWTASHEGTLRQRVGRAASG